VDGAFGVEGVGYGIRMYGVAGSAMEKGFRGGGEGAENSHGTQVAVAAW